MASLLTTGRQIKGSAMAGLASAARSEAQTNIAEEQLKQAKEAQQAQLLGTGLGIGGAYLITQGAGAGAAALAPGVAMSAVPGGTAAATAAANPAANLLGLTGGGTAAGGTAGAALTGQAAAGGTAAGAGAAGGATALLANPMTWAVVAGLYLLKKVF